MNNTKEQLLFYQMSKILMPEEYLRDFEVSSIKEQPNEWLIELKEKSDKVPATLQGKDVVLDGYCTPLDVMTHAFSLKRIYLRLHRRRWKEKGSDKHYSNTYDLHISGMKTTKEFGVFLKEIDR